MRYLDNQDNLEAYIEFHFGISLQKILAPVGPNRVGDSVRHNGVYHYIKEARRADDPTLPMGVWSHELKTADWDKVLKIALAALCEKSKDLQLVVWLLEALIHLRGFSAIAPGIVLLQKLCEEYWDDMHPQMIDGDLEFRTNPIRWMNDKMIPVLRVQAITSAGFDGNEYCLDDWDKAQQYEKLKASGKRVEWTNATLEDFRRKLAATPNAFLFSLCDDIEDGKAALSAFSAWLDTVCGAESPSLGGSIGLLNAIGNIQGDELRRRGAVREVRVSTTEVMADENAGLSSVAQASFPSGPIRDRSEAYARLHEAAQFLKQIEPHSPTPFLIEKACEWGNMPAEKLYHELFIVYGGNLNIFQLMGLDAEEKK